MKTTHNLFDDGLNSRRIEGLGEGYPFVGHDFAVKGLKRLPLVMFLQHGAIVVKTAL